MREQEQEMYGSITEAEAGKGLSAGEPGMEDHP